MKLDFLKLEIIRKVIMNRYVLFGLLFLAGLFLGWILFHSSHEPAGDQQTLSQSGKETIWTCAMHPQIRMDHQGKCPICGMDLIPLNQTSDTTLDPSAIRLTKDAAQLANVMTSVVTRQQPVKEVRLYGKVQADERLIQSQVSHLPGRIEKLTVNFTGEPVTKGQALAVIYSPGLVTAQQELLEATEMKSTQPEIYEAAKAKLRLWKLTDNQINNIEGSGKVQADFEIESNTSGVVTSRRVNAGDYVAEGSVIFEVADLSHVWVLFDAYESDLPFMKTGDQIGFTVQAIPGKNFTGKILFIDPVIDPVTRVAKVRVEMDNSSGILKPEMFATGIIDARLDSQGNSLVIPQSAVLWTGKRSVVYVKQPGTDEPVFMLREIELGPRLTNSYVVESGLTEGEEIVTEGTFSVDAAAQLEGKPSMMNPSGGKVSAMPGMDMPGMDMSGKETSTPGLKKESSGQPMGDMIGHATFHVSGNCDMCKARIEKAAKSVEGVKSAYWDEKSRKIHVGYDEMKTDPTKIGASIARAGHDTEKIKADDKVYDALPECCKYRK